MAPELAGTGPVVENTVPPTKLEEAIQEFNKVLKKKAVPVEVQEHLPSQNQLSVDQVLVVGRNIAVKWKSKKDDKNLERLNKVLKSIQEYGPIVEVFIRPVPAVKSIIWGGIKLALASGTTYLDRFEDIAKTFDDLSNWLPIVLIYQRRVNESKEIRDAVESFQESLVRFLLVVIDNPSQGLVSTFLSGFNDLRSARDKLERAAKNAAETVIAVEQDLQNKAREDDRRNDFWRWLKPWINSDATYEHATGHKSPNTFDSIWGSKAFGSWLECPNASQSSNAKTLVISGAEGCGKSTVAAAFVEQLPRLFQDDRSVLCPLFLDYEARWDDKIARTYLSTAVFTMLRKKPELLTKSFLDSHFDPAKQSADIHDCLSMFEDLASQCSPLFLLVDNTIADEVLDISEAIPITSVDPHRNSNLRRNASNSDQNSTNRPEYTIRLLCFIRTGSQSHNWIWDMWKKDSLAKPTIFGIPDDSVKKDITIYVRSAAASIADAFGQAGGNLTAAEVETALLKSPANSFNLMRAFMDYIRHQPTVADVREALKQIPPDVQQLYRKVLSELSSYQDGRTFLAFEVLKILVAAFRPLELSELTECLAIQPGIDKIDTTRRYTRKDFESQVRTLCGPFITVQAGCIQLVSFSVKGFFDDLSIEGTGKSTKCRTTTHEDPRSNRFSTVAMDTITKRCFAYLSLSCFSGVTESLPAVGDREGWLKQFPFFNYASNCWLNHLFYLADHLKNPKKGYRSEFGFDGELLELLAGFLASPNSWTYLEGSLLLSSATEVRQRLLFCRDPISETGAFMEEFGLRESIESANGKVLEDWALGVDSILSSLQDFPLETALQAIRELRNNQLQGSDCSSLPEIGRSRRAEGYVFANA